MINDGINYKNFYQKYIIYQSTGKSIKLCQKSTKCTSAANRESQNYYVNATQFCTYRIDLITKVTSIRQNW